MSKPTLYSIWQERALIAQKYELSDAQITEALDAFDQFIDAVESGHVRATCYSHIWLYASDRRTLLHTVKFPWSGQRICSIKLYARPAWLRTLKPLTDLLYSHPYCCGAAFGAVIVGGCAALYSFLSNE